MWASRESATALLSAGNTLRYHPRVNPFTTTREAKEYLIAQIVAEAAREGQPLTDIEHRMLYFTETAWMPEDFEQVNSIFKQSYDDNAYEQHIGRLVLELKRRPEHDTNGWHAAAKLLNTEDHYLSILINPHIAANRPSNDALKLLLAAFVGVALLMAATFLYHHLLG